MIARTTLLQKLQKSVLAHYKSHGRHYLPWRKTKDPYKILVSEIMLQQTQADRVVPKYKAFIKKYPTAKSLARATLAEVLGVWSGLGYNRRAKYLWEAAKVLTRGETSRSRPRGLTSKSFTLEMLPGVGPYTAKAVRVFAYNKPEVLIETNIRTVYLHHLFPRSKNVPDKKLLSYMIVPRNVEPRVWYAALMDYGSYLKSKYPNPSRRSAGHTKQSKFKGSDREIRGAILRAHLAGTRLAKLPFEQKRVRSLAQALHVEGMLT